MRIETVTSQGVSLRISRAELPESEPLTAETARAAVLEALRDAGQLPWEQMEIHLIQGEEEVLILAKPAAGLPFRFRFSCFSHLAAAAAYLPAALRSDAVYIDGGYELLLYSASPSLPNAVYEFGEPMPCSPELTAHLLEQGDVIAADDAAAVLQKWFC